MRSWTKVSLVSVALAAGLLLADRSLRAAPQNASSQPRDASAAAKPEIGATPELLAMGWLAGAWAVEMKYFTPDGQTMSFPTESTIEPMLDGSFLKEQIKVPAGPTLQNTLIGIRSFDRFRKTYRLVWFDSVITLADVYDGDATESGFSVSNVKSGTSATWNGVENFMRITQTAGATRDEFMLRWEVSSDGGKTWRVSADYSYQRKR